MTSPGTAAPRPESGCGGSTNSGARLGPGWVVAGVALFWVLTVVAGLLAPGYSARADYVSSLAGRGSSVAVLGVAALTVLGLAHLAAAAVVRGWVAAPLALAGLCGLAVAWFRTACPLGAAGCGSGANETVPDLADTVHYLAVVGYEVALVVAMLGVAVRLRGARPVVAALTVTAAVASVVLALQIGGPDLGAWQRAWLAVNTAWPAALALTVYRPRSHTG
ncbi:DUF998 domain-containing protein [Pseudonocardia sp.]|uniref:DUF998 domain-containing protein n=1 Tax=Pseudonocardia sp. TaxID=60912 RepID=UPI00261DEC2D|nr:DUF998 domain-containing protein [Pseudonocardia sp.]